MNYDFPEIKNVGQVESAIRGRDEFTILERDDFFVVLYRVNFIDTFPPVSTVDLAIRRELRGIKFDKAGDIIARPYHKFFNVNERLETLEENVDWNQTFDILDKLDGSMVHPMFLKKELVWCTKAGPTDISVPAEMFAVKSKANYVDFSTFWLNAGWTPLFEWCSNQNRIVLSYPEDQLILTGMRHIVHGSYIDMDMMYRHASVFDVPVVQRWPGTFEGISAFNNEVQDAEDEEGYVFRFSNGHMLKRKNIWYLQLHKIKELFQWEKDIWRVVISNNVDDAKSFMDEADKKRIDAFATALLGAIDQKAEELKWEVIAAKDNLNESKKKFAIEVVPNFIGAERGILFAIWDGYDPRQAVVDVLLKHCNSGPRLEEIRHLVYFLRWHDYDRDGCTWQDYG